MADPTTETHFHPDQLGILHACWHQCKNRWVPALVIATLGFPFEHWLWENAPVLSELTHALGL